MGYIVLAPDFLSGKAPNGGGTADYKNSDAARTGIYSLDPEQIHTTLGAAVAFAEQIPASNGKSVVLVFAGGAVNLSNLRPNQPILRLQLFAMEPDQKRLPLTKIFACQSMVFTEKTTIE